MEKKESGSVFIWIWVALLLFIVISRCTDDHAPTVDLYKISTDSRPKINAAIEKEELRWNAHNEEQLSKEEVESIAAEITMKEVRENYRK